ncbi:MAG TPA: hypothetical protein VH092_38135 [Urbifossiella sp.]|jgi:hypothetical protein|nr:hypothetical protein [Urbifossiella sp.]
MSTGPDSPQFVLTLVHGTFATNAPWTGEKSVLRESLVAALPAGPVEFVPFNWSGRNSHRARFAAGLALRKVLRANLGRHPGSRHLVIAHSHGGNVAAYALRRFRLADRVAGVVALGTPFIEGEPNDLREVAGRVRRGLFLVLAALATLALGQFGLFSIAEPRSYPLFLGAVALAAAACGFLFSRRGPFLARWERDQARAVRRLLFRERLRVPFLCVSTGRDEARLILGLVAAADSLWAWSLRLLLWGQYFLLAGAFFGLPAFAYVVVKEQEDSLGAVIMAALFAVAWVVLWPTLLLLILLTRRVAPLFQSVGSEVLRRAGYEWGVWGGYSFVRSRQAVWPSCVGDVSREVVASRYALWSFAMRHSDLYENPIVLAAIARWILCGNERGDGPTGLIGLSPADRSPAEAVPGEVATGPRATPTRASD